jgi:hypothetical protein
MQRPTVYAVIAGAAWNQHNILWSAVYRNMFCLKSADRKSRSRAVGKATDYGPNDRGVVVLDPVMSRIFTSYYPDRCEVPLNLVGKMYRE